MNADEWPGEVCKRCQRRSVVGFQVPDEIWAAVVVGRWSVLCATCFDEEAEVRLVPYHFSNVYPVTWSMWRYETNAGGA